MFFLTLLKLEPILDIAVQDPRNLLASNRNLDMVIMVFFIRLIFLFL